MKFDLSESGTLVNLPLTDMLIALLLENQVARIYEITFDKYVKGIHDKRNVILNASAAQKLEEFVSLGPAYTEVCLSCSTENGIVTLPFGRVKEEKDIKALGDIILALVNTYESLTPVSDHTSLIINNSDFIDASQTDLLDCLRVRLKDNDTVVFEELEHSVRLVSYDSDNNVKLSVSGNKNASKLLTCSQRYLGTETYDLERFRATGVDVRLFKFLSCEQVDLFNRAVRGHIEKEDGVEIQSLSDEYFSVTFSGNVIAVIQVPCNDGYREYMNNDHVTMAGKEVKVFFKERTRYIETVLSEMASLAENVICVKRQ